MSVPDSDLPDGLLLPNNSFVKEREKIIIDTDPGIGDFISSIYQFL